MKSQWTSVVLLLLALLVGLLAFVAAILDVSRIASFVALGGFGLAAVLFLVVLFRSHRAFDKKSAAVAEENHPVSVGEGR